QYFNGPAYNYMDGTFSENGSQSTASKYSADLQDSAGVWTMTSGQGNQTASGSDNSSYQSNAGKYTTLLNDGSINGTQSQHGGGQDSYNQAVFFDVSNGNW